MQFLLDTNAVSDYMRKHQQLQSRLTSMARGDTAIICTIIRGEILFGILRMPTSKYRAELERAAARVFPDLTCLAVPMSAGDHYANTKLSCQRKGVVLDENDLWIAATALALGATLITRDKDFSQVDGLIVQDWTT
jgi:tRNA(fMet)-specific endonuclease VapC